MWNFPATFLSDFCIFHTIRRMKRQKLFINNKKLNIFKKIFISIDDLSKCIFYSTLICPKLKAASRFSLRSSYENVIGSNAALYCWNSFRPLRNFRKNSTTWSRNAKPMLSFLSLIIRKIRMKDDLKWKWMEIFQIGLTRQQFDFINKNWATTAHKKLKTFYRSFCLKFKYFPFS